MAIINQLVNAASVTVDGSVVTSLPVTTLLQLAPTIVKSVDITVGAKVGDTLTYTVVLTNLNLSAISNAEFSDALPEGCEYVTGSFKVNGTTATPTYTAATRLLTYTFAPIAALGVATITFQVEIIGGESDD